MEVLAIVRNTKATEIVHAMPQAVFGRKRGAGDVIPASMGLGPAAEYAIVTAVDKVANRGRDADTFGCAFTLSDFCSRTRGAWLANDW